MSNPKHKMPKDNNSVSIPVLGIESHTVVASAGVAADTGILSTTSDTIVRIVGTEDIYFDIGIGAVATSLEAILPAGAIEYFNVKKNEVISVLQITSPGSVHITLMS